MTDRIELAGQFEATDTVVVTNNLSEELATQADPDAIQWVLAVLDGLTDGWNVPRGGVPVAKLRLNFWRDGDPLGNLGVADTFLTVHAHGTFFARASDADTMSRLLGAVGAMYLS